MQTKANQDLRNLSDIQYPNCKKCCCSFNWILHFFDINFGHLNIAPPILDVMSIWRKYHLLQNTVGREFKGIWIIGSQ